jgi:hypothetical protein
MREKVEKLLKSYINYDKILGERSFKHASDKSCYLTALLGSLEGVIPSLILYNFSDNPYAFLAIPIIGGIRFLRAYLKKNDLEEEAFVAYVHRRNSEGKPPFYYLAHLTDEERGRLRRKIRF